ncbi:aminotransferase class I/II-fold pyridoxal phosphate-dependent enzyme [Alkalihalobacillus sp. LMS39]|uniref:aminotransferase class I/II-fold pyridoxal phosphate-dependent enzyme n=1 Tax=Alkalihalobacillus sp. LMS39 TaxID=2924032 RepID=UPI001FB4F3D4|nr:aminotransferase class I/II-fold pyridoxal phosphate-dependent enzyme [Alkalihalobacillus sp. LMS39]UOE94169.1 aminotransferase class I/II-fold pyridoxal phosphate-dependent enzyme [Alkalihalobacillus sp. LMS39]
MVEIPLYNRLITHSQQTVASFHVPGHKNGHVFYEEAIKSFMPLLQLDVTELSGLDDLHDPSSVIQEAQQLCASLYGVKHSYFLVNGSTVGNLAMILAACGKHDDVLVQRNSHKSIFHGIRMANANPIFLTPMYDEQLNMATGLSLEMVKEAVEKYPSAKTLIVTSPNYFGVTLDISEIISYAHERGLIVLVDEAHGAHFHLGQPFPTSCLQWGADVVVQSAHKTLPAMTMGSYLHINSERVNPSRIQMYLSMLQSSSPSYPIMASLDLARAYCESVTEEMIEEIVLSIIEFKTELQTIPQLEVVNSNDPHLQMDPLKITVETRCEKSGVSIQQRLEQAGIYTELANDSQLLFVLPLAPLKNAKEIADTIKQILAPYQVNDREKHKKVKLAEAQISNLHIPWEQLEGWKRASISIDEAAGKIAGEDVIPYPPGIPILLKGEIITQEIVNRIKHLQNNNVTFQGFCNEQRELQIFSELYRNEEQT